MKLHLWLNPAYCRGWYYLYIRLEGTINQPLPERGSWLLHSFLSLAITAFQPLDMRTGHVIWNLQNKSLVFYLQNEMAATNFTLSVITVSEVSTLLFRCEYHRWLWVFMCNSPLGMTQPEVPSEFGLLYLPLCLKIHKRNKQKECSLPSPPPHTLCSSSTV